MRLIDADALKIELAILHGGDYKTIHYLNHARTVDAVPVIRCKDCRWCKSFMLFGKMQYQCTKWEVDGVVSLTEEDWYCSRAERKEE